MAKEIELQNGMKAIVDDEDYERVNQYNWNITRHVGGTRINIHHKDKQTGHVSLQHFILGIKTNPRKNGIVHMNGDLLDFRKGNLKVLDRRDFMQKVKAQRNRSSNYKGVYWDKQTKKWRAGITVDGKKINLGRYVSEDEAADAYNRAARQYFGKYAYLNKIGADNSIKEIKPIKREKYTYRTPKNNNKTSEHKGVHYDNYNQVWVSRFYHKGSIIRLGVYKTESEAAKAYNEKAKELFGDKAILNDIPEETMQS